MSRVRLLCILLLVTGAACATSPPAMKESLEQVDVFDAVTRRKDHFAVCAAEQRSQDPTVKGKLVMTWRIQPTGEATDVSVVSEELKLTHFATCVARVLAATTFPKHRTAGDPIIFPFQLQ